MSGDPSEVQHILACPSCQKDINVTGFEPGDGINCPHCGHEFAVTRQFGNYRLEKQIGSGGMGAVYLGTDLKLNRVVAIKLLKTELCTDEKFISTFLREAEITASLNHPNIVQVYAFGQEMGTYYLVMEHISGGTLDDKIVKNGHITELEGLEIGIGVSSGLAFAQERGLIHRDIKPGNILFGANSTPKVVDFGLSLSHDTTDHFAGEIWGTPYYVAPEKLENQPEDFRSDMYSLGTTLFHAIAGRPPYDAEDPTEVAMKHLSGNIVSLKAFVPTVSNQTAFAISKSIARYPQDRYASYDEFIGQLEDAKRRLQEKGGKPEENGPVEIVETAEENKSNLYIILAAVVLIIVLIGSAYFFRDALFNSDKKNNAASALEGYNPNAAKPHTNGTGNKK
jgi:eukaryotic-like serine/threonine-protein kinase